MYKNLNLGALGHGGVPFDEACAIAKQHNFAGIDLDLGYLGNLAKTKSLQDAKDWFASTGLRVGSMGLSVAWRDFDSDRAYADSLSKFVEEAKLAAEFGCTRCFTWVMPFSKTLDFYQHFDLVYPRLKRVAEILKIYGMMFGLEFVGPTSMRAGRTKDFVHTMDGMRTFAAAIGVNSQNTGLLLDAWHWWVSHGTVTELACLHVDEIVYVHLNDAPIGKAIDEQIDQEREMVGATGVIPIKAFLGTLKKLGYNGPLTVEPFNAGIKAMSPNNAAAVTSAALDKVLRDI
jgi:sugar phosphate isomerase/epimerase